MLANQRISEPQFSVNNGVYIPLPGQYGGLAGKTHGQLLLVECWEQSRYSFVQPKLIERPISWQHNKNIIFIPTNTTVYLVPLDFHVSRLTKNTPPRECRLGWWMLCRAAWICQSSTTVCVPGCGLGQKQNRTQNNRNEPPKPVTKGADMVERQPHSIFRSQKYYWEIININYLIIISY